MKRDEIHSQLIVGTNLSHTTRVKLQSGGWQRLSDTFCDTLNSKSAVYAVEINFDET